MIAAPFAHYALTLDGRRGAAPMRALVAGGRTLLPVRALGALLHASVVYDARTRTIVVRRGALQRTLPPGATVRIVDGHAYAPLRAAADAFGIRVGYDARTRTIALDDRTLTAAQPAPVPVITATASPTTAPAPPAIVADVRPADGASVHDPYPAISARFAGAASIANGSLRVLVDGRDVSAEAAAIGDTVTYTPRAVLPPGTHDVAISGTDTHGTPLSARWSFADDFAFAAPPVPPPPPIRAIYIDRYVTPGTYTFDVIVRGEPGLTGAVAVDGVNIRFPLLVASYDAYVAHIYVPQGIYVPFAHVSARIQLPTGEFRTFTLPETVPLLTMPRPPATPTPAPVATPAPTPTPTPARTPTPPAATRKPLPRRPLTRRPVVPATPRPSPSPASKDNPLR